MRIKKVSQSTPIKAKVVNFYSESEEETYSCDYINNAKANSSDVYTKVELDSSLLPITIVKDVYVGDSKTVTLQVEPKIPYIFINSHLYLREIVLITQNEGTINIDRILSSNPNNKTSFALEDNNLTIVGAINCRGHLYKLNYQITV